MVYAVLIEDRKDRDIFQAKRGKCPRFIQESVPVGKLPSESAE